jgi:predicted RNA-binding Zn ribbon-like protein
MQSRQDLIRMMYVTHWDLSLALVGTIRHDGDGGVADDLDTVAGLADWLAVTPDLDAGSLVASEESRQRVTTLRAATRSLFARAVHPRAPSRADAQHLVDVETALACLNEAAAGLGAPTLHWPADGKPRLGYPMLATDPADRLLATLAEAVAGFLASADVVRLRACPAPRCVRYFRQDDPRQAWCKPSCGNRARVARHYQRHHGD